MPIFKNKKKTELETHNLGPKVSFVTSHGYFHGHECHLPAEKLSAFHIKMQGLRRIIFNLVTVQASDIRAINMYR